MAGGAKAHKLSKVVVRAQRISEQFDVTSALSCGRSVISTSQSVVSARIACFGAMKIENIPLD